VTIIRDGATIEHGTLEQLRHLSRTAIDARVEGEAASVLGGIAGVHELSVDGDHIRCEVDRTALTEALAALTAAGLTALECRPPTLEELFLQHYERSA
jgi:ABC-2 type transport system ATP-binding protein